MALIACPALGFAGASQLHGGPALGGSVSTGTSTPPSQAGYSGLVAISGAYGLNDTIRVYGHAHYALGVGKDSLNTPRHEASLSAGLAYTLDVVSVLPWFGLGIQGAYVVTPQWNGVIPAVEARAGLDWLLDRYFGLVFEAAYGLVFANRSHVDNTIMASAGVRWTLDL